MATVGGPEWDVTAPWRNFGAWAWSIVVLQTVGGLVTACVMRWADNILKCFAVALALLLTSMLSIPLFDFHLTPSFVVGASLTLLATASYQVPSGNKAKDADGEIKRDDGHDEDDFDESRETSLLVPPRR